MDDRSPGSRSGWMLRIRFLILAMALVACSSQREQDGAPSGAAGPNTAPRTRSETVANIFENPAVLYNQVMVVSGFVTEAPGANLFIIQDSSNISGDKRHKLLVINASPNPAAVKPEDANKPFVVIGTLQKFVEAEVEKQHNLTLQDDLVSAYADQPVLIATTITSSEGGNPAVGPATPGP